MTIEHSPEQQNRPLQRALHEVLVYLKARPDLGPELLDLLDKLIAGLENVSTDHDASHWEKAVREFLFKLEFFDQRSDVGRELILRRLVKSLIELYSKNDQKDNPYAVTLKEVEDKIITVPSIEELETLRSKALDSIVKSKIWQDEYNLKFEQEVRQLAVQLLNTLRTSETESTELDEQINTLAENLNNGCDYYSLVSVNKSLAGLLKNYGNLAENHRKARGELLQVIASLIEAIQALSTGSNVFLGGLDGFMEVLKKTNEIDGLDKIRETLLVEAEKMKQRAQASAKEIQKMQKRVTETQLRMLTLEEELLKTRTKLSQALKERDIDALTMIPNRRAFDTQIKIALETFSRHKTGYCLALIDIDHFKKINDTHGHPIGDKILQNIAKILREGLRKIDFLARYGGEEFVAILPNTTPLGAFKVMERIRKQIHATQFLLKNQKISVTISVGICELVNGMSEKKWTQRADAVLYVAKNEGRNRVKIAPPDGTN